MIFTSGRRKVVPQNAVPRVTVLCIICPMRCFPIKGSSCLSEALLCSGDCIFESLNFFFVLQQRKQKEDLERQLEEKRKEAENKKKEVNEKRRQEAEDKLRHRDLDYNVQNLSVSTKYLRNEN